LRWAACWEAAAGSIAVAWKKVGEPIAAVAADISIAEAVLYAGQAEEAPARADGIAASSHARNGDASASALARLRGCALALLGRVSAQ
jgi:hypothetical protein